MSSYPLSLRIPEALTSRIDEYMAVHSKTRSAAILDLIALGLDTADGDTPPVTVDELAERLGALEQAVSTLLAATKQRTTNVAHCDTVSMRTPIPGDLGIFLGTLCSRNHDHEGTGLSRRTMSTGNCVECRKVKKAEKKRVAKA